MTKYFVKEAAQMTKAHTSQSYQLSGKCSIRLQGDGATLPAEWLKLNIQVRPSISEDVKCLIHCPWECEWIQPFWRPSIHMAVHTLLPRNFTLR